MAFLEDKIGEIRDPELRETLLQEVKKLKSEKMFGLVFEEHIPELAPLYSMPIRPGATVAHRNGDLRDVYTVESVEGEIAAVRDNSDATTHLPLANLVVVKRFGEAIYPALQPIEKVERGGNEPYHTIIEADNYHALQLLEYAYNGQIDVIYIDPPYNTGARDWKYNNDYVDRNDAWRHSKWLSFMEKRLLIARQLLKPNGVLIVTIDDNESFSLGLLLNQVFPDKEVTPICIKYNPSGTTQNGLYRVHEYAFFVTNPGQELEKKPAPPDIRIRNLRRNGNNSMRHRRRTMFYPIFVDKETLKISRIGEQPNDSFHPASQTIEHDDYYELWPLDDKGVERCWYYSAERLRDKGDEEIFFRWVKERLHPYYRTSNENETKYVTMWTGSEFDAAAHGSTLVKGILGREFPYPKSLYAVKECLAAVVSKNKQALILDFFAGSGTTLHATLLLNNSDNGKRRCILVTNNEVSEDESRQLSTRGLQPGNPQWEAQGICRSVTFPRCKYAINGHQDDSTVLEGEYLIGRAVKEKPRTFRKLSFVNQTALSSTTRKKEITALIKEIPQDQIEAETPFFISADEKHTASILFEDNQAEAYLAALESMEHITHYYIITQDNKLFNRLKQEINDLLGPIQIEEEERRPMSQGFAANLEYFRLGFLDPDEVALGEQFAAILPILWLRAGAKGQRPEADDTVPYLASADSPFAVLLDESQFRYFQAAIAGRDDLTYIFLVTDSETAFFEMKGELDAPHIIMLYKDYLENFRINVQRV